MLTKIDGLRQIQDQTIKRELLELDFLKGSDLNLSNSNNNATITGLKAGVNPNDAVNKAQLDAATLGGMTYKGQLDASVATGIALDGAAQGDFWYISVAGTLDGISFAVGDHLVVNAAITDFDVDGSGNIDKIDNVNVQSELDNTQLGAGLNTDGSYTPDGTADYISAATSLKNADSLLDDQIKVNADAISTNAGNISTNAAAITALQTDWSERVFGEEYAPIVDSTSYTVASFPIKAGTLRVYINGMRGASGDYSVVEATGVITFVSTLKANKDVVIMDYEY